MTDRERLEKTAAWYFGRGFAVVWTDGKSKRVTQPGWQNSVPFESVEQAKLMFAKGLYSNPCVNLRGSGLVGFEVDGADELERYLELGLPETFTVTSGGGPGRYHFYFRPPRDLESDEKVSFRFEDGTVVGVTNNYYVGPGAIHPDTGQRYRSVDPEAPFEALTVEQYQRAVELSGVAKTQERRAIEAGEKIGEGRRRDMIFRHACQLRRWGHTEEEVVDFLDGWQQERFTTPVPRDWVQNQVKGAFHQRYEIGEELVGESEPATLNYEPLDLFQPVPPVDWVIEDLLVGGEATLLIADGGQGKSLVALSVAQAVAGSKPFWVAKTVFKHGLVVYVDEEGSHGLALQRMWELGFTDEEKSNMHYLSRKGIDLLREPGVLLEDMLVLQPTLIVLDSHSRITRSAEENSPTEISVAWVDGIIPLAEQTGAAVLVIHHTSAAGRTRGTTAIRNAADQELTMEVQKDGSRRIWASKPRRQTQPIEFLYIDLPDGRCELQPHFSMPEMP